MDKELNEELLLMLGDGRADITSMSYKYENAIKDFAGDEGKRFGNTPEEYVISEYGGCDCCSSKTLEAWNALRIINQHYEKEGQVSRKDVEKELNDYANKEKIIKEMAPGLDQNVISAIDDWKCDDWECNEDVDKLVILARRKLTLSQGFLTPKVKNYLAGFGVLCILGAVGQVVNMTGGESVSIISIPIFLAVGIALVWFSKFKK